MFLGQLSIRFRVIKKKNTNKMAKNIIYYVSLMTHRGLAPLCPVKSAAYSAQNVAPYSLNVA